MSPPLALYIHFPWCVRKCPYCDFNSHETDATLPEQNYVEALIRDLDRDIAAFNIPSGQSLYSIFMGGGTPSLMSPGAIGELLEGIRQRLHLDPDTEVTMEANPGTTDIANFRGYKEAGVNRLSLGVQTFGTSQLAALGRIHTADEASSAYFEAREAGFNNINLDLMHGLPGQDLKTGLLDLETAIELEPEHISWYQLTIEPNTVFYNRPPELPPEELLWQIYTEGTALLASAGYERYEISAFAKSTQRARHNLNYWQFGDYLGIGAGAHGKISQPDRIIRTNKTRLPSDYLLGQKSQQTVVAREDYLLEFLMNALRLVQGFEERTFLERTSLPIGSLNNFTARAEAKKLVTRSGGIIQPTELGLQYLNDLLLLADEP